MTHQPNIQFEKFIMTKILLGICVALVVALGVLGFYTKQLHKNYVTEKNNNIVLIASKLELEENVEKANETSKQFQKQLSGVDRQLASLRVRANKADDCILVSASKFGSNGTRTGGFLPDGDGRKGLSADWLFGYGARCEKTRQKAIGLQKFYRE